MRGCLFVVIIAIMFLTGAIWFGGPPLASAVVTSSLASSGFSSQTLDVEVTAEPPLTLAIGRANTIAIDATLHSPAPRPRSRRYRFGVI